MEARAAVLRQPAGPSKVEGGARRAGGDARRDRRGTANAAAQATRRSRGTSRTTARPSARCRSTASPRSATPFEPLVPEVRHVRNTNRYHRPPEETEEEFTAHAARRARDDDPRHGAGDRVPRAHGAGAERRRLLHAARGLLARRSSALHEVRHPPVRRRGDHRFRAARLLVRLRALRHPARHRHVCEGAVVVLRGDRRRRRHRRRDGAVPRGDVDVLARDHVRRSPGDVRDRPEEHRDHEARADRRGRARARGRVPLDARAAPRSAHRR